MHHALSRRRRNPCRRRGHHFYRRTIDRAGASAARPLRRRRRLAPACRRARRRCRIADRSCPWRRLQSRRHAVGARRAVGRTASRHSYRPRRSRLERTPRPARQLAGLSGGDPARRARSSRHRTRRRRRTFLGRGAGNAFCARLPRARRRSGAAGAAALSVPAQHDLALRAVRHPDLRLALRAHAGAAAGRPVHRHRSGLGFPAATAAAALRQAHCCTVVASPGDISRQCARRR